MKKITCVLYFISNLIFITGTSHAQYHIDLVAITNSQDGKNVLEFGASTNIKISLTVDSTRTLEEGLNYLKNYYLIINGIPYPDNKIQNMGLLSAKKANGSVKNVYEIIYQTRMPAATQDSSGKIVLSKFWKQQYMPLHNELELPITILSPKSDDQAVSTINIKLLFYDDIRIYICAIGLGIILIAIIWFASRDNFTLFRDDSGCTIAGKNNPFSLARLQVFIWTFAIFGCFAYLWGVTDFLPPMTPAHLVLLGIAAGQKIISQIIDKAHPPKKNLRSSADGCSVGFFTDLVSDKSGLSITRLQYLIANFIFIVVFITNAIQKLQLIDFSVEQLALMGTSAGLYLWNKQLDQQKP